VVSISDGFLSVLSNPSVAQLGLESPDGSLPPQYSPRDWMEPYRLPRAGETFRFDTLTMRDLFFLWNIIKYENPPDRFVLRPWIQINDSIKSDFFIQDFSLFKGPFNSIPPGLADQWFFWDRLREYARVRMPDKTVEVGFAILRQGTAIVEYTVKHGCTFCIADSWRDGFDSRYFGPVGVHRISGAAACVLWSFDQSRRFPFGLRNERLCRIAH
jgi:hypothetical protein